MDRHKKERVRQIIGLGDLSEDGHIRLTEGDNFKIHDGSEESHALMQDLCIRINHELDQRGEKLEHLSRAEFVELLKRIGAAE